MGKQYRKQSITERKLNGSYQPCRHKHIEDALPIVTDPKRRPVKPDWLPERASQYWDELLPTLIRADSLMTAFITVYVISRAQVEEALEEGGKVTAQRLLWIEKQRRELVLLE